MSKSLWYEYKLKEVLRFFNGKAINVSKSGSYPVYGSNGLIGYTEKTLFDNAVVIGRVGAYCGATLYEKDKFWASDNTIVVKALDGFDIKYVSYLLGLIDLNWFAGDSAQPLLTHGWIKPIPVKAPPLPTQQKIARILSAYDDLIENNLKRIKLLEEMAQLTYEEWFVRLKFPEHEQAVIDPETGLPEGWSRGRVVDLFELQRGFDLPIQDREPGEIPILASTGITGFHSSYKVMGSGVITGRSGTIGRTIFVGSDFWPLNTTLWVKKYKSCGPLFVKHFLDGFNLQRISGGAAVPALDRKSVHCQKIILPPSKLMKDFETFAQPLFELCRVFDLQNKHLKEARDILLPRLMTGMIDVELPEIVVNIAIPTTLENNREASVNDL